MLFHFGFFQILPFCCSLLISGVDKIAVCGVRCLSVLSQCQFFPAVFFPQGKSAIAHFVIAGISKSAQIVCAPLSAHLRWVDSGIFKKGDDIIEGEVKSGSIGVPISEHTLHSLPFGFPIFKAGGFKITKGASGAYVPAPMRRWHWY